MANNNSLHTQLWNIANTLRGKMGADDFRDYILGFIFYKYLSEKMHAYANVILQPDKIRYKEIDESTDIGKRYIEAVKDMALEKLGYFLKPSELFSEMAKRGNGSGQNKFILDDLAKVLNSIEQSTMVYLSLLSSSSVGTLLESSTISSTKCTFYWDCRPIQTSSKSSDGVRLLISVLLQSMLQRAVLKNCSDVSRVVP